jgi:hypothetical protein
MPENININNASYDIDNFDFHETLKDIENLFLFFVLSNLALINSDVQEILKNHEEPTVGSMLKKYNKWVNLKIEFKGYRSTSSANIKNSQIAIGKALVILTYDYLLCSPYNSEINGLDEFKFLKFIRNGAAHGNEFNLKDEEGEWKLMESETIIWANKKITRESHKRRVFNDFLSFIDIFLLANLFSQKLKEIDKRR